MKKKKDEKGITLVTLVVTIVVLIILAGISISALSGKNGLLEKLKEVKEKTKEASENENSVLTQYEKEVGKEENSKVDIGKEKIKVSNGKIVTEKNEEPFLIKGVSVVQVFNKDNFEENRSSKETIEMLKKEGFNTIRYQLTTSLFYDFDKREYREDNIKKLKEYCKNAQDVGMYVIIDMHALKSGQLSFWDKTNKEYCMISDEGITYKKEFVDVWQRLAEELKDYKSVLVYELMNEPNAIWKTSQEKALENYSNLLNECIEKIREKDEKTIISFQPILNYMDASTYTWTEATAKLNPDVKADNLLYDSNHFYDNTLFQQKYGILNVDVAEGASQAKDKWNAGNEYSNISQNVGTYSTVIEAGDLAKKIKWVGIRIKNNNGAKVTVDNYKIYKINNDDSENEVLNVKTDDDSRKLFVYGFTGKLGKTKTITSDNQYYLSDNFFTSTSIGLMPNEKIRLEVQLSFDKHNENTGIAWEYTTNDIEPNDQGKSIVTGYEKLENTFIKMNNISAEYGSPLYFGEICVKNQYINEYTNYKEYTDAFAELTKKYNLNWIWHRMSEYPADNGYGLYVGTSPKPEEKNKRKSMWDYIVPKLLNKI